MFSNRVLILVPYTFFFFFSVTYKIRKKVMHYWKNGIFTGVAKMGNLVREVNLNHKVHLKPKFWKVKCCWDLGGTSLKEICSLKKLACWICFQINTDTMVYAWDLRVTNWDFFVDWEMDRFILSLNLVALARQMLLKASLFCVCK